MIIPTPFWTLFMVECTLVGLLLGSAPWGAIISVGIVMAVLAYNTPTV